MCEHILLLKIQATHTYRKKNHVKVLCHMSLLSFVPVPMGRHERKRAYAKNWTGPQNGSVTIYGRGVWERFLFFSLHLFCVSSYNNNLYTTSLARRIFLEKKKSIAFGTPQTWVCMLAAAPSLSEAVHGPL